MTLLERLHHRVDEVHDEITNGGFNGLCSIVLRASHAGEISAQENLALADKIGQWQSTHPGVGYVVFYLEPAFDSMMDNVNAHAFPNVVSIRAAYKWRAWAVGIVQQAQQELDNADQHGEG